MNGLKLKTSCKSSFLSWCPPELWLAALKIVAITHLETIRLEEIDIKPHKLYSLGFSFFCSSLLQNLLAAMGQTVKNVIYVLVLLFLLIFIFAILGHGLYGDRQQGDPQNWGSLAAAFFTLFSLVTVIFMHFT